MLLIYMSFIDDESHRRLFEEIYLSYRKQMFLVARTVLKNDSDAEDIVHDVFLRIAKKYMAKISTIENETDLRNYLLKATKNAALDHLRKHRHERVRRRKKTKQRCLIRKKCRTMLLSKRYIIALSTKRLYQQ